METKKLTAKGLMIGDWVKIKEPNKYASAIGTIQNLSSLEGAYFAIYIYAQPKLKGFTQVKSRRRLTKKQRKQLKNKKQ